MMERFARVITDDRTDKELEYRIPESFVDKVQIGSRVKVPVRSRETLATVVAVIPQASVPEPRELLAIFPSVLHPPLLDLARWMSEYYCCPIETAIRSVLPQAIRKSEISFKRERMITIDRLPSPEEFAQLKARAPRQAEILRIAAETGAPIPWQELKGFSTDRTIQQLVDRGWFRIDSRPVTRDPHGEEQFLPDRPLTLNGEQAEALRKIIEAFETKTNQPILLHGITGSGKTEIYLQAIESILNKGFGALVLVPEISLTPQTVERFKMRFSSDLVAVLHSHLSTGERHDEWHRLSDQKARIAIGARSAIFAPVKNLGLIVVDEEHETSYKQEESPRYNGRDLAIVRAQIEKCAVLLGSATPSIESFYNVRSGKYLLLELKTRVDDRQLPIIRVIDMRREFS
ncbi:MAG: primosomal protein N', partial [Verrucomicrobia bacterium]|nr:primosomal protein N' [Verrucomicrobiota bacterium]